MSDTYTLGADRTRAHSGSEARIALRAWVTEHGVKSSYAVSMTMPELNACWLDITNSTLNGFIQLSQGGGAKEALRAEAQGQAGARGGIKDGVTLEDAQAILNILNKAKGDAKLDEARVIELVRQYSQPQPLRIEYKERHSGEHNQALAHKDFPKLLKAVSSGENVWLYGPAGTGKTTAAEQVAAVLGRTFHFNGALDSEHKLLGFTDAQGRIVSRPFRKAWTEGGVYLFDEVDASLPQALLAFNAALANGIVDFPDGAVRKHPDFVCIAGANTIGQGATVEYNGRYKPDAAFVDRFAMIRWDVDETLERTLALGKIEDQALGAKWIDLVQKVRRKVASEGSVKHVVSPRASIGGCALLHAGFTWDEAIDARLRKGLDKAVWDRVSA